HPYLTLFPYTTLFRSLHVLGEAEVKHGAHVSVVNLYTEELGNPEMPQKFVQARHKAEAVPAAAETPRTSRSWIIATAALVLVAGDRKSTRLNSSHLVI